MSAAAVAAYRRLQHPGGDPAALKARRRLALALWRYSMLQTQRGRPQDAMAPGREGVRLAREVLDAAPTGDAESDELAGELATAMNDLSQAAALAGLGDEHLDLMRDVVVLCEGRRGPLVRQALGTTLHNQAVAAADRAADTASGPLSPADMSQALALAGKAVELRRELVDPARPVTLWELANSLQLRGSMLCSATMGEQGATDLLAAWQIASGLQGASAEHLRGELSQAMRVAEATYPDVVATLDWPVLPRSGAQPTSSDRAALAEAVVLMQRGRQREAATVLTRLAESGSREAMHALALLRDQMGDSRQAGEWFLRAAEAGLGRPEAA